jgi:hypothetical protein
MTAHLTFCERLALRALLAAPHSRAELDRAARARNSPHCVLGLRAAGVGIHTERVPCVTLSGRRGWFGRYSLTSEGRVKGRELLGNRTEKQGDIQ